jgi:hypothetical protein
VKAIQDILISLLMLAALVLVAVAIMATVTAYSTNSEPSAIEVFGTRFDECMATERFTREECIAYADEGE